MRAIEPGAPARVDIRDFILRMVPGDSMRLEAQVFDSAGLRIRDTQPYWLSWNVGVATVSDSGLVRAVKPGWAVVRSSVSVPVADSVFVAVVLRFKSLTVGNFHACAVTPDNALYCWGNSRRYSPASIVPTGPLATPVEQANDALTVAAGEEHTCRITTAMVTYCWGSDVDGQRGDGIRSGSYAPPQPVWTPEPLVTLSASGYHTCGITASERVFCWGINDTGELGLWPDTAPMGPRCYRYICRDEPVEVPGVRLRSVSAGLEHTCGLDRDGRAFCWGANEAGQLGIGATGDTLTARAVSTSLRFQTIAAGYQRTCAITTDGDLYCWGRITSSTQGVACHASQPAVRCATVPIRVEAGVKFKSVSVFTSVCAVSVASALYCSTAVPETSDAPISIAQPSPGVSFEFVDVGYELSCALGSNGAVYCWGPGSGGYTGTGLPSRNYPVMISPPGPVPSFDGDS